MARSITVEELITTWGFDVNAKPLQKLGKQLESIKKSVAIVGTAAVASGAALFGLAKSAADFGDSAAKTADKLGLGVEALQEYRFAAKIAGVEQNTLDLGIQRFIRRAAEAAQGTGEAKAALAELGITLKDSSGNMRSMDDLLADVADALQKTENSSDKVRLAFKLFDSEGVGLVNLLQKGSGALADFRKEARDLGIVMSEEDVRAAEKFTDSMTKVMGTLTGFKNLIGAQLFPIIEELIDDFMEWVKVNRELIKTELTKFIEGTIRSLKRFLALAKTVWKVVDGLAQSFGGWNDFLEIFSNILIGILALKLLSFLGTATIAVTGLGTALKGMGLKALFANASLLAIPIAIGAIVAAIALIAEDIFSFTQGRDSVFGRMLDGLDQIFDIMKEKFGAFGSAFQVVIFGLLTPIRILVNSFRTILDLIDVFRGKLTFLKLTAKLGARIRGIFGLGGDLSAKAGFGITDPAKALGNTGAALGINPNTAPASNTNIGGNKTISVRTGDTKIIVPAGSTPEQAKILGENAASGFFDRMLREADRDSLNFIER